MENKTAVKKRRKNVIRRAIDEADVEDGLSVKAGISQAQLIADLLIDVCNIPKMKVYEVLGLIEKNILNIQIKKELPDDVRPTVIDIEKILLWHASGDFELCSPDLLVKELNRLSALRAYLSGPAAWYSAQATLSVMNRRNWKALAFSTLRTFGRDLEANIKNKATVADVEQQSEIIGMFMIEPQVYNSYVSEYLQNILSSSREVITGIDRKLTELKYQRQTEGRNENY